MVYISLIIFILLLSIGIFKQKRIPDCISSIYYNIGHWFTLLLGGASAIIMPYIIDITPETYKFTSFLCCAALCFVAFAPHYKDMFEGKIHFVSAYTSAAMATIWTACTNPWCLSCLMIGVIGTLLNKNNWLWWCEIACFSMIYITLLLI